MLCGPVFVAEAAADAFFAALLESAGLVAWLWHLAVKPQPVMHAAVVFRDRLAVAISSLAGSLVRHQIFFSQMRSFRSPRPDSGRGSEFGLQFAAQQFLDHSVCGRAFIEHPAHGSDDWHLHAHPLGQPSYRPRVGDAFNHRMSNPVRRCAGCDAGDGLAAPNSKTQGAIARKITRAGQDEVAEPRKSIDGLRPRTGSQ